MRTVTITVAGSQRTYWDFYVGFGIAVGAFLLVQAIVLWLLSALADTQWERAKPIVVTFGAGFAVNALIVGRFFFVVPMVFVVAIVGCLGIALLSGRAR